jgi:hypothetical protein
VEVVPVADILPETDVTWQSDDLLACMQGTNKIGPGTGFGDSYSTHKFPYNFLFF